jgi:hypothetical protein
MRYHAFSRRVRALTAGFGFLSLIGPCTWAATEKCPAVIEKEATTEGYHPEDAMSARCVKN